MQVYALMQSIAIGTLVATPDGPQRVEQLQPGARVLGHDQAVRRVQWAQPLTAAVGEAVHIPAGSLAPGLPTVALTLSPETQVGFDPAMAAIPAADLLDGALVTRTALPMAMIGLELDIPGGVQAGGLTLGTPSPATPLAIVEALAALAHQRGQAPGPLRSNLDRVARDAVTGWAFDPSQPGRPVPLLLIVNGVRIDGIVARGFRADLEHAGMGDGRVAFRFTPNPPLPADRPLLIQVRRATDLMPLHGSPILLEIETQAATPVAAYPAMTPEERARLITLLHSQIEAIATA